MGSKFRIAALALVVSSLAACGGGGGGSDDEGEPPAGGTSVEISGVAATGAATVGGAVEVKCASGAASATTQADGSYAVTVADAALPCVIRVTKDGAALHSLVETGATLPAVAHVTPLTELLVAQITTASAASVFDTFDAPMQAQLTSAGISTASDQIATALSGIVDLSGDDLLRGTLVAAVGDQDGNLLDQKLDALARALQDSGATITELSETLVANPGEPPELLEEVPASADSCPALRSGTYWGLEAEDPQYSADPAEVDARALTITYNGEEPVHLTPVEGQPCRFTIADDANIDGPEQVVVSRAGMIVTRFPEDGLGKVTVGFPKQDVSQAELVGDWNYVGWVGPMSDMTPVHGAFTLNAAGEFSNVQNYVGLQLEDEPPGQTLSLVRNATTGAFNQIVNGETRPALFLPFRTADGRVVLVGNPQDGPQGLIFAMKRSELALPAVGTPSNYWELGLLGSADSFGSFDALSTTVTAVDGSNVTRRRPEFPGLPVRIDVMQYNVPRAGMRMRAPNACTNADGTAASCAGMVQLVLQGVGVTVAAGLSPNSFFVIATSRP